MKTEELILIGLGLFLLLNHNANAAQQQAIAIQRANMGKPKNPIANNQNTQFWVAQGMPIARDLLAWATGQGSTAKIDVSGAVLDAPKVSGGLSDVLQAGADWMLGGQSPNDSTLEWV